MRYEKNTEPAARREGNRLIKEYEIDDSGGEALIRSFASAYSLEIQCQRQIDSEGLTYKDRFEQPKQHPLLACLRDARAQKLAAIKSLNLDVEPLQNGPGRPLGR